MGFVRFLIQQNPIDNRAIDNRAINRKSKIPMASGTFEKTNFGWEITKAMRRFGEWMEWILSGGNSDRNPNEDWSLPPWLMQTVFWSVVILGTLWLLWQIYRLLSPYLPNFLRWNQGDRIPQPLSEKAKAAAIASCLNQFQQARQQGDFRAACRALYMAALQQLNDREIIRDEPSRTDGEYVSLLAMADRPQPYQVLVRTHEQLHFSSATASDETCDRCLQAYREIENG
jgi:hypothetical protein